MNNREQKRNRLMDAIGSIDDRFLTEAARYRPKKQRGMRSLLLAACLTFTAVLVVLCVEIFSAVDSGKPPFGTESGKDPSTLDEVLLFGKEGASCETLSEVSKQYIFNGKAYLIWQYADSSEFTISRALTEAEVKTLVNAISKGKPVGENAPAQSCRVWLTLGDGTILTPYLPATDGNKGAAVLFDYEAELEPSEDLIQSVTGLLTS